MAPLDPPDSIDPPPVLPRVAAGDPAAASACLDRYGPLVWSVARRTLACDADAEDVTQETFMSLWRDASKFDPHVGNEAAFVATIARRRLADHVRRSKRPVAEITAEVADDVSRSAEHADEAEAARAAMRELTPEQKRVLDLSLFAGLTYQEVAERAAMPLSTVKSHARRGVTAIREHLRRRREAARVRREQFRLQREAGHG